MAARHFRRRLRRLGSPTTTGISYNGISTSADWNRKYANALRGRQFELSNTTVYSAGSPPTTRCSGTCTGCERLRAITIT